MLNETACKRVAFAALYCKRQEDRRLCILSTVHAASCLPWPVGAVNPGFDSNDRYVNWRYYILQSFVTISRIKSHPLFLSIVCDVWSVISTVECRLKRWTLKKLKIDNF